MAHRKMALEFRANQLEHMTGCRVTGGVVTAQGGVCFRLAAGAAPDLGQLRQLFGRGVRAQLAGRELSVEIDRQVHRAPLGQVIAGRELPRLTAVLGINDAGKPALFDLTRPASRHLLIAGAGEAVGATLLETVALSLVMLNRQRDMQLLPIGNFPWKSWPHRLDLSLRQVADLAGQIGWRTIPAANRPALMVVVNLETLTATEHGYIRLLLQTDAAAGVHILATAANAADWPQFQAGLRPGGEPEMWQLTVSRDQAELQAATATAAEIETAIIHLRAGRKSRVWMLPETLPARRGLRRLLGG
ncbi:MAG: hypothetical protein FOGNACKC_06267 [Anaerolineae bacterium]|nr:hypothetical protein [Anaerolineae bacterium]